MHPLAVARDELADEVVIGPVRRALDKFQFEGGDFEVAEVEIAFRITGVNIVADFGAGKVGREKFVSGGDVLDRERHVIEVRATVRRRLRMRLLPIWRVPELDQRTE